MTQFVLGHFRCVVFDVGYFTISASTLLANATEADRAAVMDRYDHDAEGIIFRIKPLLVETGQHRVLIDPGTGDDPGLLLQAFKAEGIDPASVTTVIITHAHPDHYSGSVNPAGDPAFPQARYFMQRAEWEHWQTGGDPAHFVEHFRTMLLPIRDCFTLLDGDGEIVPGIAALTTPGHSPGHMAILVGDQMVCVGNSLINLPYIEGPDWVGKFENWPEMVVQTRRALLQRITQGQWWVYGYHFPLPGTGHIVAAGDGWQWVPEALGGLEKKTGQ